MPFLGGFRDSCTVILIFFSPLKLDRKARNASLPFRRLGWPYRPLQMHLPSFCAFTMPPNSSSHSFMPLAHARLIPTRDKRGCITQIPNLTRERSQIYLTTVFHGNVWSSITLLLNASVIAFPVSSAKPTLTGSSCSPLLHTPLSQFLELPGSYTFCWNQPLHPELLLAITQALGHLFGFLASP